MRVITFVSLLGLVAGSCPTYDQVAQPGVAPDAFSMQKLAGKWYVLATNEPTVPNFCKHCYTLDFDIFTTEYRYGGNMRCFGQNMSMPPMVGGLLGDAQHPGDCRENVRPFNTTIKPILMPNMFFDYNEEEGWYMSYACGPFLLGELHSFFFAARSPIGKTKAWIEEKIAHANASGLVDTSKATILDESTWTGTCGVSAHSAAIVV